MLNYSVEQGWAKYGQREVKKARKYFYQSKSQQEATKASFIVAYNIATENKVLSNSEFLKKCMLRVVEIACQLSRTRSAGAADRKV